MSLRGEGSVFFWVNSEHPDWQNNNQGYKFGPISNYGIDVLVLKNPDRTLSVFVSGALDQTVVFHGPMPEVLRSDGISVVISWRHPVITLFIQGKHVNEVILKATKIATLPIKISSHGDAPPMELVGIVLDELSHVFNTVSGFLDTSTAELCRVTVENALHRSKFSIASSRTSSWEAVLNGTQRVFEFVKRRFGDFLAVCSGYGDRLANAHVSQREAEAELMTQKANQEKLNTIARASEVARDIAGHLSAARSDLTEIEKQQLLDMHFITPMQKLARALLDNQLRIEIHESDNIDPG